MTISSVKSELKQIGKKKIKFEKLLSHLADSKNKAVKKGLQEKAKEIWIYEQIIKVHLQFNHAFSLLKSKLYYEAWCQLEGAEIDLSFLKRHFLVTKETYKLKFIERTIQNMQVLFPYRLFASSEIVAKRKLCSTCKKEISIRNPCGHIVGEIYNGEMCSREVVEADVLGMALVENPVNKYSVMFLTNEETKEKNDHYDYESVDYLMKLIEDPYESWNLELREILMPHTNFPNTKKNDACPCASGEDYEKCCMQNAGVRGFDYHFILSRKTAERLRKKGIISMNYKVDTD